MCSASNATKCPLNNGVPIVQKLVVKLSSTSTMLFPPVAKTNISTYTWKHGNLLIKRSKGGITQNRKTVSEYTGFYF